MRRTQHLEMNMGYRHLKFYFGTKCAALKLVAELSCTHIIFFNPKFSASMEFKQALTVVES